MNSLKPDVEAFLRDRDVALSFPAAAANDPSAAKTYLLSARSTKRPNVAREPVAIEGELMLDDEIPARFYIPSDEGIFPIVIYFHGGGWVLGDVDMHDATCRQIANRSQCSVLNVGYRLAPENAFPVPLNDCILAVNWAHENANVLHGDAHRMVVAGSSAGGNLAAAVALHARDQGSPSLAFQVLIYPVIDSSMTSASYQLDTSGTLLDRDQMAWYWNQYVPDQQDKKNPLASPAHSLSLKGLPPAYVITAEFDPLRDEGEEYARRLRADGVDVISTRYDGQIHGFMGLLGIVSDANTALNDLCLFLRDRLSS